MMKNLKVFFGIAVVMMLPVFAYPADYTWNGSTTAWDTATNWSPNGDPNSSTDNVEFSDSGSSRSVAELTRSVGLITFSSATDFTIAYNGTTLNMYGGITRTGAGIHKITGQFKLMQDQTWTNNNSSGYLMVSYQYNNPNGKMLTIDGIGTTYLDFGNDVVGAGIIKNGAGTLYAYNTEWDHHGPTTINQGTIAIQSNYDPMRYSDVTVNTDGTLDLNGFNDKVWSLSGSGSVILGNNTLTINDGNSKTFSGVISGTGNVVKDGTGTATFTRAIEYTGTTTISNGTLAGTTTALWDDITNNAALNYNQSGDGEYAHVIDGTGEVIKSGAGVVTFSGVNTYTGKTTINGGWLSITQDANLGTAPGSATPGHLTLTGGGVLWTKETFALSPNRGISIGTDSYGMINVYTGTTLTYGGVIAGSGSLYKVGAGILKLGGVNTYSGETVINEGTVQSNVSGGLSDNSAFTVGDGTCLDLNSCSDTIKSLAGSGSVLLGGATLTAGDANNQTFSGVISGDGGKIVKEGAGTWTLAGSNTYTGGTTVNAGTLSATTATIPSSGNASVASAAVLKFDQATNGTYGLVISGDGSFEKAGAGTLTLSVANTYAGKTVINGGVLSISADNNLGTAPAMATPGHLTLNGGTLQCVTETFFSINSNRGISLGTGNGTIDVAGTVVYSGIIADSGNLTKSGTGWLSLGWASTYTGSTTITGGILSIYQDSNLGTAPGVATPGHLTLNGGELYVTETMTLSDKRGVSLGAGNGNIYVGNGKTLSYGGIIAGSGALTKSESGTFTLSGVNTYTGSTTIAAGTLSISQDSNLGAAPASATPGHLVLNGGALNVTSAMTLSDKRGISLGAGNGEIIASDEMTYGGIIAGSGALTKSGWGTVTLTAVNSYSGATTITGGYLAVNGSILNSAITVNGGALAGTGTVGAVTLNSGGGISPGVGTATDTLTSGDQIWNEGGYYYWDVNGTACDLLNMQNLDIRGITTTFTVGIIGDPGSVPYEWTIATFSGLTGTFNENLFDLYDVSGAPGNFSMRQFGSEFRIAYDAVPEPSVAGLFLMSLPFLGGIGWRMRARKK